MQTVKTLSTNDDKLLQSFFADNRHTIPDDGFTRRVMAALPPRHASSTAMNLRRWQVALNIVGAAATLALVISIASSAKLIEWAQTAILHLIATPISVDVDSILVNILLLIHSIPQQLAPLLPSPIQLTALFALITLLCYQAIVSLHRSSLT